MKLNSLFFLTLLIISSTTLVAADFGAQNNLPIDISADSGDLALGDGINILKKNIHIKQGQLEIIAEMGKIHTRNSKVVRIELEGNPVTWHQVLPEGGILDAQARAMNYEVAKASILLTGDVHIVNPQGEVRGHQIRYDLTSERLVTSSSGGDDRVHFRINSSETSTTGDKGDKPTEAASVSPEASVDTDTQTEADGKK